jgi:tetratricopeptide (TPR) repeat protein
MKYHAAALVTISVLAGTAHAADKPVIAPPPAWVKPVAIPTASAKPDEAPVRILLSDQQILLDRDGQTVYSEVALKLQTPQGLAAGNISFPWRPDTDTLTVHKLLIRRGDQVIDVLASGQTFTVLRREQNLENATLDGMLTATIQPEGLQVGDIIDFAASISSSDPIMKGHVEQIAAAWNGIPVGRAHLRMQWPTTLPARLRAPYFPAAKPIKAGGVTSVEFALDNLEPLVPPKGAPLRYQLGRMIELTDFANWSDLGALMAPLYVKAATLPGQGPLRTELDRMTKLSPDPKVRAEAALALVQDRVRYVALAMGAGGYVPADAELTWSRRYGDCKGKTALLLALLHAMDIEAVPVAVNATTGDGLDARLPMVGLFNHVLVRATIAGQVYWLDGTRAGDSELGRLQVPNFGWGLPLVAKEATLVRMLPAPLTQPGSDVAIHIDARAGLTVPAPTRIETVIRGDDAVTVNAGLATLTGEARDRALRQYWKGEYDFIDVTSATATFDAKAGELRMAMEGVARMDWSRGEYETDGTSIGYKADFSRDAGQDRDAPFVVAYPYFSRVVETIALPRGFREQSAAQAALNQTIAGVTYHRSAGISGQVFTVEKTEKSVTPEFPARDAPAAQAMLRELADKRVYLRRPEGYSLTDAEVTASLATTPATADAFVTRGNMLLDRGRFDEAIKDFQQALALDPKHVNALADRGIAYVWKGDDVAAAQDLDAAQALDARNPVVFRARGLMAQRRGDFKAAVAAYTTSLEIEPNSVFALAKRADAYHRAGDDAAALRDADAVIRRRPDMPDLYLLRANIFRNGGKLEEALKEAAALEAAMPDNAYAHVAAANLYRAMHHDADAMKAYQSALAIKPEAYIYVNRSQYRPAADVAGKRADLDAAIKLDPTYVPAMIAKAKLQSDTGEVAGAIATLDTALVRQPGGAGILTYRGIAYARGGDRVRAEKDFAQSRNNATEPAELNNICWAKATAGVALESALIDCNAALARQPDVAGFLDSRALVSLRLGRLDAAIADYDHALAKNGKSASSLFGRAVAWARKGDKAKSDADAAAASSIDPDIRNTFEGYGITL